MRGGASLTKKISSAVIRNRGGIRPSFETGDRPRGDLSFTMPITEMITMTAVGLFFLLAFIYFLRLIQAWMLHRSLREAISKDSVHAAMLVDRIGRGDLSGPRIEEGTDDRTGLVLIAIGAALAGFSLIANEPEWLRFGLGGALFRPWSVRPCWLGALYHQAASRTLPPERDPDTVLCRRAALKAHSRLLVETHERRLRAFLKQLAGPDLANELAQEAFLKAWQSLHGFREEAKFSSWLCAIGWRLFVDHKRREKSEGRKRAAAAELAEREQAPAPGATPRPRARACPAGRGRAGRAGAVRRPRLVASRKRRSSCECRSARSREYCGGPSRNAASISR